MQPFEQSPLEPSVIGAAWRYRWMVGFITIALGAGVFAATNYQLTTEYSATASLQVEDPRSSILFDVGTRQRTEDYVADQVSILRSAEVARRATEIANENSGVSISTEEVLGSVSIFASASSSVIGVTYRSSDAAEATAGANAMIQAYQDLLRTETQASFASSIQVLDDTIEQLESDIESIRSRIIELTAGDDAERSALRAQFAESLPKLNTLVAQLLATQNEERRTEIRAQISDILLQIDVLEAVNRLGGENPEVADLLLRQTRAIERIDDLAQRRDRILLDSQLLSSGVTLTTPAFGAVEVASNTLRAPLIAALTGLLAGTALAYLLALRRRNFTDRGQPELILGSPLIAEVPTFKQEGIKALIPVRTDPLSASAEAFRFAAAALQFSHPRSTQRPPGGRTVAVVSAAIGEGKTIVAANTALAAALEGSRVLLIDADFGNQMATALLAPNMKAEYGLTEVVEAGVPLAEAIVPIEGGETSGLHLLTRGWRHTTAPEFFRLHATQAFLQDVQEFYDLVLIDGPPLLQVAYASTIAGLCDKVLAVVPHGASLSSVEELQDRLDLIGTPSVGYVYNLAPLRFEMTRTEGSMKDVLGRTPVA